MATTIRDVLASARDILSDTREPYRHSTGKLLRAFNLALTEAFRLRPDLFRANKYSLPSLDESNLDDDFPLPPFTVALFVQFIPGFVELADDEFALDGRAVSLLNRFAAGLTGAA